MLTQLEHNWHRIIVAQQLSATMRKQAGVLTGGPLRRALVWLGLENPEPMAGLLLQDSGWIEADLVSMRSSYALALRNQGRL